MNYNEWRDELKSNLLCVSENERRRVLDYYAEAYADRREAGFSEKEIIDDFGAPYDAAQRILADNKSEAFYGEDVPRGRREKKRESAPPPPPPPPAPQPAVNSNNAVWIAVLLCVIFCVPLFGLVVSAAAVAFSIFLVPVCFVGGGAVAIGGGIASAVTGDLYYGLCVCGAGIILLGIGIILCPLFHKLIKIAVKLCKKVFLWIKSLFTGRKGVV